MEQKTKIYIRHFLIPLTNSFDGCYKKSDYILSYWVNGCLPFSSNESKHETVLLDPMGCDFINTLRTAGFYLWGEFLICSVNPRKKIIYAYDTETGQAIDRRRHALYKKAGIIPSEFAENYGVNYLFVFPFISDPNENPKIEGVRK
jgi:hypothetical protein